MMIMCFKPGPPTNTSLSLHSAVCVTISSQRLLPWVFDFKCSEQRIPSFGFVITEDPLKEEEDQREVAHADRH